MKLTPRKLKGYYRQFLFILAIVLTITGYVYPDTQVESPNTTQEVSKAADTHLVFEHPTVLGISEGASASADVLSFEAAKILRVVDGDTIEIELDGEKEKVRIIGINTPESVDPRRPVECFGKEASAKAKELFEQSKSGEVVYIESDPSQSSQDRYGRLLRFVYLDGGATDFGLEMIKQGYAQEYTYDDPYAYQIDYLNAQVSAQVNEFGLWDPEACVQ